ncbi:MAG TPA: penicillin-binding protein 2 [Thermoanaerobaculia bacterium]|nr:penicillin-binding protein 2 [Thermoanaerobaculia bacterium]
MKGRFVFVALFFGAWSAAVAARLYVLQVARHDHYAERAAQQQQTAVALTPARGTIYDARGRELAVSVQVDSAFAVPRDVEDPAAVARELAAFLGGDPAKLQSRLDSDKDFVWVARKLDPPVGAELRRRALPGIHFVEESKRYYPMRELAAQVLGYVGTDDGGLAGLELVYDEVVAGRKGERTVLRDARRGTVVAPDLAVSAAEPGRDLHLTLDATIQHIVERELARAVEERHAQKGSAVFLDPATGAVLAMATYPGFDPNEFARVNASRWRNRAIMDVYEPGSTFKVITAAAAFEAGLVAPGDPFECEMGGITLAGIRIRDHKAFGRLTFAEVMAKSSNVGVIKTALLLGDERLHGTVTAFGFGQATGIDLPGESPGILQPLKTWRPLTKAYISFGQGIAVTPLQLAAAVGAVANGGTLLKPHVVAALGSGGDGELIHPRPPVVGQAVSPRTAATLRAVLEGVVIGGTGKGAAVPGYRVAGKTGTAQKAVAGGYSRSGYVPSFVGFAPVERPVLVGVVAVDEPGGWAYHGGQVAAPLFGAIARQVLLYLGVRPDREPPALWPGELPPATAPPQGGRETLVLPGGTLAVARLETSGGTGD